MTEARATTKPDLTGKPNPTAKPDLTGKPGLTRSRGWFVLAGLLVALVLAGVVSNFASGSPDGLDATLREGCVYDANGIVVSGGCPAQQEREHQMSDSVLAGYEVRGVDNPYLSNGVSGVLGVLVTFGLGAGAFWLLRRRGAVKPAPTAPAGAAAAAGAVGGAAPAETGPDHRPTTGSG